MPYSFYFDELVITTNSLELYVTSFYVFFYGYTQRSLWYHATSDTIKASMKHTKCLKKYVMSITINQVTELCDLQIVVL